MLRILRRRLRDGQRLHEERVLLEERAPPPLPSSKAWETIATNLFNVVKFPQWGRISCDA